MTTEVKSVIDTITPEQLGNMSQAEIVALDLESHREFLDSMTDQEAIELEYNWRYWARPKQLLPEGKWTVWMRMAGRGEGKTRSGSETVRAWVESGNYGRIALVGRTASDVRDVMIEGDAGILAVCPPWNYPRYMPSKRRLTWPNGAIATGYTADKPDALRGPQHDAAWGDEAGTWKYTDTMSNLRFGLRRGKNPKLILTTTPRPRDLIRKLAATERAETLKGLTDVERSVIITRGSSYENTANLTEVFFNEVISDYIGTELGRQEIYGELLEEAEGALWVRKNIDENRISEVPETLKKIVVGVDPAGGGADYTGIVVAAMNNDGWYVLEDASMRGRPEAWARRVIGAARHWGADYIVAEKNFGGEMVESTIKAADSSFRVRMVSASKGKAVRAQPASLAYERGVVHHVGEFNELEDQLTNWVPEESDYSPDRLDALVWALTELRVGRKAGGFSRAVRV